jgi:hypothetical protein
LIEEAFAAAAATDEWVSLEGYPGLLGGIYPRFQRETQTRSSLLSDMTCLPPGNLCIFVVTGCDASSLRVHCWVHFRYLDHQIVWLADQLSGSQALRRTSCCVMESA